MKCLKEQQTSLSVGPDLIRMFILVAVSITTYVLIHDLFDSHVPSDLKTFIHLLIGGVISFGSCLIAYRGILRNVIALQQYEQIHKHYQFLAFHDSLTGLPNRALFHDRTEVALSSSLRTNTVVALMIIDVDNFKYVNDSLGHAAGDLLLETVASRMSSSIRSCDTLARLGGDEFGIMITDLPIGEKGFELVSIIAKKLTECVRTPIVYEDRPIYMSISVGVALSDPHQHYYQDQLLKHADFAMYDAKRAGRNGYKIYSPDIPNTHITSLDIQNGLYGALERNEIVVYYQPQMNVHDHSIKGAEALIRWNHPECGIISPAVFVPVAEETNLIVALGERVLILACLECKKWHDAGYNHLVIAVNLSARQFQDDIIISQVENALAISGLPSWALELEITETLTIENSNQVKKSLTKLKEMGIVISIDDFGTGYSSFGCLNEFPIQTLKIDQSFVRNITDDSSSIVRAIIQMAKELNHTTVAEGVETLEHLELLKSYGVDVVQGYFLSAPIPANEFYNKFIVNQINQE